MRSLLAFVIATAAASDLCAQTVTTTVDTTTVISDAEINSATLSQLVSAIKSFDGKVLNVEGQLYWGSGLDDTWHLTTDDGLIAEIELDDGRSVTQEAKKCTGNYRDQEGGCSVSLNVEMDIDCLYSYCFFIKGVGFDVVFK